MAAAAPNAFAITANQFEQLLAAISHARQPVQETRADLLARQDAAEQPQINEFAQLRTLSQAELGRRLVQRLTESHGGMRSPGWTAGRAVAETAAAQALPVSQQSMSLTEAMREAHALNSPAWTRPAGVGGVRTIFDA